MLLKYDGSFYGFLSAIFSVYEFKLSDVQFVHGTGYAENLFLQIKNIDTEINKADRVLAAIKKILFHNAYILHYAFLSELPGIEDQLLQYIRFILKHSDQKNNQANTYVLQIHQTAKKVYREKHRMEAFIRFEKDEKELFFAQVEPDFNVLPLISNHFEKRYADQHWLIFDSKRKYGIYYDLHAVHEVEFNNTNAAEEILKHGEEKAYQQLWRKYFTSVNIASRKNTKLHIQHMPKRYWKLLTEKQITF